MHLVDGQPEWVHARGEGEKWIGAVKRMQPKGMRWMLCMRGGNDMWLIKPPLHLVLYFTLQRQQH